MFGNLISRDDFILVAERIRQGYGERLIRQAFRPFRPQRVKGAWKHTDAPLKNWASLEPVQQRLNLLATGEEGRSFYEYVCRIHLTGSGGLRALSIGCGTGTHELRFAQSGLFSKIDGIDVSENRIREAQRCASKTGLANVLAFQPADVRSFEPEEPGYDIAIAINAIHHIVPLRPAVGRLASWLKPGGLLILRDYVGPARFQWSDRQVALADEAIAELPQRYRTRWGSDTIKSRVLRPGKLAVRMADPSEAAESDRILEELARHFQAIERRDLGGALLHLVLKDIAHNFASDDEESRKWLQFLFDREDKFMAEGKLSSDFVFAVYRVPSND